MIFSSTANHRCPGQRGHRRGFLAAPARILYLDRNYNDTLGLMHENARNSRPIEIAGVDAALIEPRLLSPLDLAVTKLSRFCAQDREDIELLARRRLIDAACKG